MVWECKYEISDVVKYGRDICKIDGFIVVLATGGVVVAPLEAVALVSAIGNNISV